MIPFPITEERIDRELVRRGGLYQFLRLAWPVIEASEFTPGWHLEEVAKHLEAVSRGEIKRLVINIPPGFTKSVLVSVVWPAWDWILFQKHKFMFASFDLSLSQRDAMRSKELLKSAWFQKRWGWQADPNELRDLGLSPLGVVENGDRQSTNSIYWNTSGGLRFSTSVGGRATGWHAHRQIVDDPTKPNDLQGGGKKAAAALQRTDEWWNTTMPTRRADPEDFARVIMMQRLHAADLAGISEAQGDYTILRLPMRYVSARKCKTKWGGDRRTEDGALLWPARFSEAAVKTLEKDLGPQNRDAQLQQDPSPEGGTIFERDWFNGRFSAVPSGAVWFQSWDCTFDDTTGSDYVVGQVWAKKNGKFYLVDMVRARMSFTATCRAIESMTAKWPASAARVLVEKKANGPAVISTLRQKMSGLIAFDPGTQSKAGRAWAVSGLFEAGDVLLAETIWVADYINEMTRFPKGINDDVVDATTQALLYWTKPKKPKLSKAMDNV